MNFKKISISFLSILALSSFLFNTGYAQSSQGTTVATVSISNAKIVSQADRDFTLSFDISNKVGAQPDIKYGVQLFQTTTSGSVKVEEQVYDEVLSLGSNTTINKSINYTVPSSVSAGTYKIYIVSKNSSGLPLGIALAGQANIGKSTVSTIKIDNSSCYVVTSTSADATKYPIDLGFSIKPKDNLILKCKVTSTIENTTFKTNFVTKSGSAYGDVIAIDSSSTESVLINKGTNNITLVLPKASKPQGYNLSISLESAKAISNIISINYNLMGQIGVIQNVVFDKTYYGKGDKASLQIYSTQYGTGTVSVIVTDENNEICSATTTQNVSSFSVINLPVKITKDCNNPKANIILAVEDKVLDSKDFNITSNDADKIAALKKDMITKIIVIVIAIIGVLLIGLFVKRSKKSAIIMLVMLAIAGFWLNANAEGYITSGSGSSYLSPQITSFAVIPNNVFYGNSAKLSWNSVNLNSCTLFGGSIGTITGLTANSSYDIQNLISDATYKLYCTGNLNEYNEYEYISEINYSNHTTYGYMYPDIVESDSNGNVYVADSNGHKIYKYDSSGNLITKFGSYGMGKGAGPGQFGSFKNIAFDSNNNLYVADTDNNRVQKFDSNGNYISQFGAYINTSTGVLYSDACSTSDNSRMCRPVAIAIDSKDRIYVSYNLNTNVVRDYKTDIQVFSSSGQFLYRFGSRNRFTNGLLDGMIFDSNNNLYVLNNSHIQKFNSYGSFLKEFGSYGSSSGQFLGVHGDIAINSQDELYVADTGNNRVQKFDSNGNYISQFGAYGKNDAEYSCGPGGCGTSPWDGEYIPEHFSSPMGIAIDPLNNIYVADHYNYRVKKFAGSGIDVFVESPEITVTIIDPISVKIDANPSPVKKGENSTVTWSASSSGMMSCSLLQQNQNGEIDKKTCGTPDSYETYKYIDNFISTSNTYSYEALSIDSSDNFYISLSGSCSFQKIKSDKTIIFNVGGCGTGNGKFDAVKDIVVDSNGNIYATDYQNHRVQKFTSNGTFVKTFGSYGTTDGKFANPWGIEVDSNNNIYVVDSNNYRVQKFTSDGVFIKAFGNGRGTGGGQFSSMPMGIAIDSNNYVYVLDSKSGNIQTFDSNGIFKYTIIDVSGVSNKTYNNGYYDLSIDSDNYLYITDINTRKVYKISTGGKLISSFGEYGFNGGQFVYNERIAVDSNNNIYVADSGKTTTVQKFTKTMVTPIIQCNLSGSQSVKIATTTEFTISCQNKNNSATASTTIEFDPAGICKIYQAGACKVGQLFMVAIWADPESVDSGDSSIINWEAEGADSCSLTKNGHSFSSSNESSGSVSSGNLTSETTFKVECTKTDEITNETETQDVSVTVGINEEVNEEPGEQEQNNFDVTLSCDAKQGTSTDYYINRNTTWEVKVNNPKGAKLDRRSWSGTNVSSNSTSNTLDKIYTTVGNKTMNIVDVYSLNGATSSAKCSKTIKLKLDSGTNTEI